MKSILQDIIDFQVKWMKIDNFRNVAQMKNHPLTYVNLKHNYWLSSVTYYANPLQISSQSDEN